ncbi:hypothetical protein AN958_07385 [Leucoagaricus sp. SymC.cos]|nr:hypothetical protein AN958_07385 [Leucoagaricus sp. SymC.cos]
MVKITAVFVLSALSYLASAAPVIEKRIAQNTVDSKTAWEAACNKAGGGAQCNQIAVVAAGTLLRGAGDCDQQNSADQMIDLAKKLNNDPEMIRLAQIFVQQPRNAPDSLQVPYCQQAPKNAELNGLFHCQFAGSKFPNFSGGGSGTVPLGLSGPVNPPGSCPAKPDGPVPDGVQLNTLVQNPGVGGATGGSTGANNGASGGAAGNSSPAPANTTPQAAATSAAATPAAATTPAANAGSENGQDAKALNQKFAGLTANSPCQDGENACVGTAFAQCAGGKFTTTPCAGGLICAALPLVNSPGTSVTCTTAADRDARIAATGV